MIQSSRHIASAKAAKPAKVLVQTGFAGFAGFADGGMCRLSVAQEAKRFQRNGVGYSKDLETHKAAIALYFGIYNYTRVHASLGSTRAVAAGVEYEVGV